MNASHPLWKVYYFFWKHTAIIRRIWCKHNGVMMGGTGIKGVVCANCFSSVQIASTAGSASIGAG